MARVVPRLMGDYEIWRLVHRTTGLFVAIGFAHGIADATAFDGAPLLRRSYVVVGGIGLVFYAVSCQVLVVVWRAIIASACAR